MNLLSDDLPNHRFYSVEFQEYGDKIVYSEDRKSWRKEGAAPFKPPRHRWSRPVIARDMIDALSRSITDLQLTIVGDAVYFRVRVESTGEILKVFRSGKDEKWQIAWPNT